MEQGAEEYEKDADIAAHAESLAVPDVVAHEAVVFVRRIAHHKGPDNRQKSGQQDEAIRFVGVGVPGEAEEQQGVGVPTRRPPVTRAIPGPTLCAQL